MRSRTRPRGLRPIRFRLDALAAPLALAGALACLPAGVGAAPATSGGTPRPQTVRTVAQDGRGATFDIVPPAARFDSANVGGALYSRVSLPGAVVVEQPGKPALPTLSLYVAVPDGMSPRLRVTTEEWDSRPGLSPVPVALQRFVSDSPERGPVSEFKTEPDPGVYQSGAAYPLAPAALGAGALVGEWWVAPVHVHPVRWDPRAGSYRVLRRMTVRVDFVPATDRELAGRPATRPGAQARAWDRVQRGLVQNYEAARAFPARPRSGTLGAPPSGGTGALRTRSRLAANPEWKLSIAQTGWFSVSYATLATTGFPSGIAIANVRVEERGYDDNADAPTAVAIPVVARDNNSNGTFDSGDAITFYARSIRDRYGAGNIELRYSDVNVYWLTFANSAAPTPQPMDGTITGGAVVPSSFNDVMRLEQNNYVLTTPNSSSGLVPREAIEYFFWTNGFAPDNFQTPITFVDPDNTKPFRIRARYQGQNGSTHHIDTFFNSSTGATDTLALDDVTFDNAVYLLDTGFTIPGAHMGPGINRYRHSGRREVNGIEVEGSQLWLDVIEVTYPRLYRTQSNYLRFTSSISGSTAELHVVGFSSPGIEVYDVTDPLAPARVTNVSVTPSGGGYQAAFQTDATAAERRFIAFVPGAETALSGNDVVADVPSDLRPGSSFPAGSVARTILITPTEFTSAAARLAQYRRSQGYVVEQAEVQDIYDEFNGGVKSAHAIRRYLRHGFLSWSPRPTFVLLCGDASLDYRHLLPSSSVDRVPTYLRFEVIPDQRGPELVAQDAYYSINLAAIESNESTDFTPSVFLGRIPAGNASELDAFVSKLLLYEDFKSTDSWRGRQLLVSDDEFSSSIFFSQGYCYQPQETQFHDANLAFADSTSSNPSGQDIQTAFYNLKTYTDAVPATPNAFGCKSLQAVKSKLVEPGGGYDSFASTMSQGYLIVNMESHANRYLVAHEEIFCGSLNFCSSPVTMDQIQNVGREPFLMIWGCHTNQFPDGPVGGADGPGYSDSTDAVGEQFLLTSNRGSISSLGSSAYEFLQTNAVYNEIIAGAFYATPPATISGQPQVRWILGEVLGLAAIRNALVPSFQDQVMNHTVNLLGDPMLRMDALPPRLADVTVAGQPFADAALLATDSPTDSLALVAQIRDEVGIDSIFVTEQDVTTQAITPLPPSSFAVTFSDSSRLATLTGNIRPRVGNYDLQLNAMDINRRLRTFTLQVRTPIRYLANNVEILNGVFVENGSTLRGEVTSPIPLTADSLTLLIDGAQVAATAIKLDAPGRRWALELQNIDLTPGTHTIQAAIGGRTTGFDQRSFQTTNEFILRGVAIVDPRVQGAGCGGQVFQYELSAAARKVELQIYTVAGRRVANIDVPGRGGFNVYCWDGRDSQAHETARGVYLYRLRATDPSGRTVSRDGRMIRVR